MESKWTLVLVELHHSSRSVPLVQQEVTLSVLFRAKKSKAMYSRSSKADFNDQLLALGVEQD